MKLKLLRIKFTIFVYFRSHSFHGKSDKKERKYAALQNRASASNIERKDAAHNIERKESAQQPTVNQSIDLAAEEKTRGNAKSILLTEDNLAPLNDSSIR